MRWIWIYNTLFLLDLRMGKMSPSNQEKNPSLFWVQVRLPDRSWISDYATVHPVKAIQNAGYEAIIMNYRLFQQI